MSLTLEQELEYGPVSASTLYSSLTLAIELKMAQAIHTQKMECVIIVSKLVLLLSVTNKSIVDFGDEHPEASVLGVDLSPIQPQFLPLNVMFEVDDIEDRWLYSQNFDYIHSRMMIGSLNNFPRLFQQAFQFLKPGGWLEMMDPVWPMQLQDGEWPEDSALKKWSVFHAESLS